MGEETDKGQTDEQTQADLRTLATNDIAEESASAGDVIADELIGDDPEEATPQETAEGDPDPEADPEAEAEEAEAKETEESQTPEPEPEQKPEDKTVPLSALHEERGKHRSLRDDPAALQRRLDELKGQPEDSAVASQAPGTQVAQTQTPPHGPDPDVLTEDEYNSQMPFDQRAYDRKCEKWKVDQRDWERTVAVSQLVNQINERGRKRFTSEAMGEHLDYDTVTDAGRRELTGADWNAIGRSDDREKTAYELCLSKSGPLKALKAMMGKGPSDSSNEETEEPPSTTVPPLKPPKSITEVVNRRKLIDANDRTPNQVVDSLLG